RSSSGPKRQASYTWRSGSAASAQSACSRTRRRCSRACCAPSRRPPRATTCSRWRSPPPWGRASASTPRPCGPPREDGSMRRAEKIDRVGALLDGLVLPAAEVKALATLPAREVLLAQLLGLLQAPAAQLLRTLNEPAARVARLVDSIGKRAGGGAGEGNAAS